MKLNTKKIFFVGLAFLIICMFWQVYDNIIAKMLINTFGLNQTWSGVVMALDNVFALILLPVFGALSDKTKTKIGKRKPYIIIGTVIAAVFFFGVAIFDNLQMKSLVKNQNVSEVVEINENAILPDERKEEILKKHTGDFWFDYNFTEEETIKLFNLTNEKQSAFAILFDNEAKNIRKYFKLTDTDLEEEKFLALVQKVLTQEDKEEFNSLLSLSHEERTKIVDGKRIYAHELSLLEKRLSERISEQNDKKEILLDLGIREFFSSKENATQVRGKIAWVYTKSNIVYLIGFLVVLLIVLVAMSTFRTPAVSLMPDVTIKPLRSKANAIINLMGTVGGIISLGLISFFAKDYHSYLTLFIVVGVIMIALLTLFCFTVNEPKLVEEMHQEAKKYGIEEEVETEEESNNKSDFESKEVKKSFILILLSIIFWYMAYNAATTKFSVYAGDVLDMGYSFPLLIANATALISFIPIGIISSKLGRKKTILIGVGILFVAFFLGSIATTSTKFLVYFTMGLAGIGWATINVNSYPMIVEMSKESNVGKYTGYYYTASMFAQIITPIVSGVFMDVTGTMRVLFPYSALFCVLAFITMLGVKHGDCKPIANVSIEAFEDLD